MVCRLLEAQITAGFSWSHDSSLGRSSVPKPQLRRLDELVSIWHVWWHRRAVQNHPSAADTALSVASFWERELAFGLEHLMRNMSGTDDRVASC